MTVHVEHPPTSVLGKETKPTPQHAPPVPSWYSPAGLWQRKTMIIAALARHRGHHLSPGAALRRARNCGRLSDSPAGHAGYRRREGRLAKCRRERDKEFVRKACAQCIGKLRGGVSVRERRMCDTGRLNRNRLDSCLVKHLHTFLSSEKHTSMYRTALLGTSPAVSKVNKNHLTPVIYRGSVPGAISLE